MVKGTQEEYQQSLLFKQNFEVMLFLKNGYRKARKSYINWKTGCRRNYGDLNSWTLLKKNFKTEAYWKILSLFAQKSIPIQQCQTLSG